MRYSAAAPMKLETPDRGSVTGAQFLRQIAGSTSADDRRCGILLVGGTGPRDLAVRHAQAAIRLDALPSYWSQAALVVDWPDGDDLSKAKGVEVALDPPDPDEQVPERNGVTVFHLSRYEDRRRWPNLAFGTIVGAPRKVKDKIVEAALQPNRDRLRYRFYEWIGVWSRHVHAPHAHENPVVHGIPHPGAALCEYAYEAARLDLTPGATAPNACPEILWATLLRWHDRLEKQQGKVRAWAALLKDVGPTRTPLSPTLDEAFGSTTRGRPGRRRR